MEVSNLTFVDGSLLIVDTVLICGVDTTYCDGWWRGGGAQSGVSGEPL